MAEATLALALLDAAALSALDKRALALQALIADGETICALPETVARFRVFADVLAATRTNLAVLRGSGAAYAAGGAGWGR